MSCHHCGQGFTTPVGLQYHNANKVCGDFGDNSSQKSSSYGPAAPAAAMVSPGPSSPAMTPYSSAVTTPGRTLPSTQIYPGGSSSTPQYVMSATTPASVLSTTPLQAVSPSIGDPYAHLTPENRAAMEEELKKAEVLFGEKMRQAEAIPDPSERRVRLDGLKNSFGTRQSMIRKRYGVRLRERRSKAEIEAQRNRMGVKDLARTKAPNGSESPTSSSAGGGGTTTTTTGALPPPSATTTASPRPSTSGWTAANTATTPVSSQAAHDAKRRRVENGTVSATASPATRQDAAASPARKLPSTSQPAAAAAIPSSLPPSQATITTTTPSSSARPAQTYTTAGARVEIHQPQGPAKHPAANAAGEGTDTVMRDAPAIAATGSESRPISITGSSESRPISITAGASSDDSDTNDDGIPARLPPPPPVVLHGISPVGQPPSGP